jgi:hypothetical protein
MARAAEGLKLALSKIAALREQFWRDVKVPGSGEQIPTWPRCGIGQWKEVGSSCPGSLALQRRLPVDDHGDGRGRRAGNVGDAVNQKALAIRRHIVMKYATCLVAAPNPRIE